MKSKKYAIYVKKKFCDDKNKKSEYDLYHKVRDHCHYTGKFRGAAHNICNLRYNVPKKIPIVFHNGSKYDYHFVIKELAKNLNVNLNAQEKIQKNMLLFQYHLKKKMIMVNQSHIN